MGAQGPSPGSACPLPSLHPVTGQPLCPFSAPRPAPSILAPNPVFSLMEGRWLETRAQTPSPNAGKAPLGTSSHGPRTLLVTCVTHTASQSTVSLQTSTDGSGRGRRVPRQGSQGVRGQREGGASRCFPREESSVRGTFTRAPSACPGPG